MKTRRRNDLPFPHVWRRFSRTTGSGETLKFKIQDCPEEMYDDLMDFMIKYFMRDETWNKALGIGDEELAVKEFTQMQSSLFSEKLVLICISDDGIEYDLKINKPKILGFSLMTPVHIDDPPRDLVIKSKAISKLFEMFGEMDKHNDIFERYNVKEYLGDAGLSVGPDARGLGLGKELLMARIDVAKSMGLKVIEATFTSHISQGLAEKCGFETVADVPYREFEKTMDFDFKTVSESIKIMAYVLK